MTTMFDVRNSAAFRRLRETELVARAMFLNQPLFLPGILQEPEYAQAMISGISGLPADDPEVIERVQVRRDRHAAFLKRLDEPEPPQVRVVLDESVLHRAPGGPGAMRAQIEHLIEISQRPSVELGILPLDRGPHQGLAGSFEVHDSADDSLVFFEGAEGDRILADDPQRIALYRDLAGALMAVAASGDQARALMSGLISR